MEAKYLKMSSDSLESILLHEDLPRMLNLCRLYHLALLCLVYATASPKAPTHASYGGPRNESLVAAQVLIDPFPFYVPPQDQMNTPSLFPMPECHGIVIEEATIDDLQDALRNGQLTSLMLAECFLKRREQVDVYIKYVSKSIGILLSTLSQRSARVDFTSSVLDVNPDYRSIASSLDYERAQGTVRGPLHGE